MNGIFRRTGLCLLLACEITQAGQGSWEELARRGAELSGQGNFTEAESALLSALKMASVTGQPNLQLAETQHHLGMVYRELGRLPEAEKWYQRSLFTWKECVGKDDPSIAKPLISLTSLYLESGMASRAEWLLGSWARNPIQIMSAADPQSVLLLHNLAALEYAQRRYSRAEILYRHALKVAETTFGPESQEVALLMNNLGMALADSGRRKDAGAHLERALAIWEKTLPSNHPDLARALMNLAGFYCSTGGYADAELLFQRALTIAESSLGPENRLTGKILAEYAGFLRKTKRKSEAKALDDRAQAIRQRNAPGELGRHTVHLRDLLTSSGNRSTETR